MHAHAIENSDLELYAAVGVTQLRVTAVNPADQSAFVRTRSRGDPVDVLGNLD